MSVPPLSSFGLQTLNTSKLDVSEYNRSIICRIRQTGISQFLEDMSVDLKIRFESEFEDFFADPYGFNSRNLTRKVVEISMILFDGQFLERGCETHIYDIQYHRQAYLDSFLESYLAVFLLSSEWFEESSVERIITDIFLLTFRMQTFYIEGTIVDKAKQLFGHVNRDLLVGSFLKQYLKMKRSCTIPIDVKEHFLYSIDMMKKGLWVLPLKRKEQNVRASLKLLTTTPEPYQFDDIYYDIALACIPTPQYERKDRAPSTKSSYECRKGNGIHDMYAENFLEFCFEDYHFLPITEAKCYNSSFKGRKSSTYRYKSNYQDFGRLGGIPWTDDLDKNEEIYSELISYIHAKFVDVETYSANPWTGGIPAAKVTILDEANKNRFLTIQRWIFQNGARSFQKHALKNCWFESPLATHKDVCAQTLYDILNKQETGPIGEYLVGIDYSSATDYMHPMATDIVHKKLVERCKVKGPEKDFLLNMFHPKVFMLQNLSIDHPDYPPTSTGQLHPHLRKISKNVDRDFGQLHQKCGQMMGNPLSFANLCVINTAVCIASLLKDRGYKVERYVRGYTTQINSRLFIITRISDGTRCLMNGKRIRNLLGPISINGDDGFLTGSIELPKIHKEIAKGVGLKLNELKTETDKVCSNMNSVRFMYDRESNEVRVTGYVNLSLLFANNVKTGKTECVKDDLGSNLTTLLTQSSPKFQERIYSYYKSIHTKVYHSAIRRFIYNPEVRTKVFIFDDNLEVFPEYLGGLGLPTTYDVACKLSEEQIERRFVRHSKQSLVVPADSHQRGLPHCEKEIPPADELHSYRTTILAKSFALTILKMHNEENDVQITAGPISPNSIQLSVLIDKCISLFSKRFRIAPVWNENWCEVFLKGAFEGIDLSETIIYPGDFSVADYDDPFYKINLFIDGHAMTTLEKYEGLFDLTE